MTSHPATRALILRTLNRKGMGVKDLARAARVDYPSLRFYLNDEGRSIRPSRLRRVLAVLGGHLTISDLLRWLRDNSHGGAVSIGYDCAKKNAWLHITAKNDPHNGNPGSRDISKG